MTKQKANDVRIDIVSGVEGPSVYINDLRVAGPKPWGGGEVVYKFSAKREYVDEALSSKDDA